MPTPRWIHAERAQHHLDTINATDPTATHLIAAIRELCAATSTTPNRQRVSLEEIDGGHVVWELRRKGHHRETYTTRTAAENRAETASAAAFPNARLQWNADSSRTWYLCAIDTDGNGTEAGWDLEMVYVHTEPVVDEEVVVPF